MTPSKEQAIQFAIMCQAGLPESEAIQYFTESRDPEALAGMLTTWRRCRAVQDAYKTLLGKSWQDMSLDEKIRAALDQHYAALAYFLLTHNYSEVGTTDKAKADTARLALEAKLAGTAGKTDALSQFFDDLKTGKIKLSPKPSPLTN